MEAKTAAPAHTTARHRPSASPDAARRRSRCIRSVDGVVKENSACSWRIPLRPRQVSEEVYEKSVDSFRALLLRPVPAPFDSLYPKVGHPAIHSLRE